MTIGFSTCPNDTFIFDAMVHHKIDTEGLDWEVRLADVEQLNQWAFDNTLDITKLSYHALGYALKDYALLPSGSALGRGCGPLLIAKDAATLQRVKENSFDKIVIPGRYTTAYFLLRCAFPELNTDKITPLVFHQIEDAVLGGKADAGLIIHENRFTYQQRGLVKLMDLGQWWEEHTGLPIPLGGIAVNRRLPQDLQAKIQRVLYRSIQYAFAQPEAVMPYVRRHAQEMDEAVMKQHISLYVNDFTLNLGVEGKQAIEQLYTIAVQRQLIPPFEGNIWAG